MMLVGALFLGLNVAPTEEMVQIACDDDALARASASWR